MAANVNNPVNVPVRNNAQPAANAPAANSPAANAPASNAPAPGPAQAADAPPAKASSNQIMGFFEGFVKEGVDTVGGLYTLVTTNPVTTAKGLVYMATHPKQAVQAITEPYTTAFREGNYGELAGRLSFQALTFVVTSGALAKTGDGAKAGDAAAKGAQVAGDGADVAGKGAQVAGKGADVAAAGTKAATTGGQVVANAAAQADPAVLQKAIDSLIAKHPKLTADAAKSLLEGKGSPVYRAELNSLTARYTAEAGGASSDLLDKAISAAGRLPKGDVYQYVNAARQAGVAESDITANLAKFAGEQGGKDALRAATSKMGATAAASTATAAGTAAKAADVTGAGAQAADAASAADAKTLGEATGQVIDGTINGVKGAVGSVKGAVRSVGQGIDRGVETVGQAYKATAEGINKAGVAVKGVYDASFTLGDVASGVAAIPSAIGRGVGAAYNATVGKLVEGIANIRLVNPFHVPDWNKLASVQIRPLHILASPVTVPLGLAKGAVSLAIHNPIRFMGVAGLVGDVGNAAGKGIGLKNAPVDPTPTADDPGAGFKWYALQPGDSLSSIAKDQMGDANRADEIYQANQELFDNAAANHTLLQPGTKIRIPTGPKPADVPTGNSPTGNAPTGNQPTGNHPTGNQPTGNQPTKPVDPTPKPAPAPSAPADSTYTVKRGDNLWDIAQAKLGDPTRWRELVAANKAQYPSLETNPDFLGVGWTLKVPAKDPAAANQPAAPANNKPGAPAANKPVAPAANQPAANGNASKVDRGAVTKTLNLDPSDANWQNFINEASTYPQNAIGPDTGSAGDRKAVQQLLANLGFPVQPSGNFDQATAQSVVAFKKLAGISQSYNVMGADGKPAPDVNEYVDSRTLETMQVTLRLLQDASVRKPENMQAAVKEAANLQNSSIGPETGSAEARGLVQQYLGTLGYSNVKATGDFDQATIDALVDFKKKHNLAASYKDDNGNPVYTPYVDGPTAQALFDAAKTLSTKG